MLKAEIKTLSKEKPLFPQVFEELEKLNIGEFIYLHKEVHHKLSLPELSGDIRGGLQRRNLCSHFEREVIYDPSNKLKQQKILKITKIK